jgi:hypothetical protein
MYRTFVILLFIAQTGLAQVFVPLGSRAFGMGGASSTLSDNWANNAAGLGGMERGAFGVGYMMRYNIGLQDFATLYGHYAGKINPNSGIGVSVVRFGADLYNQQKVGVSYGYKREGVSVGVSANYFQIGQKDLPSISAPTFDFGAIVRLAKTFFLGAYILNFTQSKLANFQDERVPTILRIGTSYRPNDKLFVNVDAEKDIEKDHIIRAGLEYKAGKYVFVRTGVVSYPVSGYFGTGLQMNRFKIDYGLGTHPLLGLSHQVALTFLLKDPKPVEKTEP